MRFETRRRLPLRRPSNPGLYFGGNAGTDVEKDLCNENKSRITSLVQSFEVAGCCVPQWSTACQLRLRWENPKILLVQGVLSRFQLSLCLVGWQFFCLLLWLLFLLAFCLLLLEKGEDLVLCWGCSQAGGFRLHLWRRGCLLWTEVRLVSPTPTTPAPASGTPVPTAPALAAGTPATGTPATTFGTQSSTKVRIKAGHKTLASNGTNDCGWRWRTNHTPKLWGPRLELF